LPLKAAKKPAPKPAKKAKAKAPANKAPVKKTSSPKTGAQKIGAQKIAARSASKSVKKPKAKKAPASVGKPVRQTDLLKRILASLDDDKAENVVTIDLEGRSALCDAAVIASGRSSRHVSAMAEHLARRLKEGGYGTRPVNGQAQGDWVLVDAGDVIVHLFRPEVRDYYDLEGMWSVGCRK
jgi:ribosome-associated protein